MLLGLPKQLPDNNLRVYSDKKTRYPALRKGTLASRRSTSRGGSGQSISPQILIRPSSPEPGVICTSPTTMDFITEEPEDMSQGIAQNEDVTESRTRISRRPAHTLEATLVPVTPCSSSCSSGRSSPIVVRYTSQVSELYSHTCYLKISISAGEDSHTVFENSERSFTTVCVICYHIPRSACLTSLTQTLIDVLGMLHECMREVETHSSLDTTDVLNMKQLVERLWYVIITIGLRQDFTDHLQGPASTWTSVVFSQERGRRNGRNLLVRTSAR